MLSVSTFQLTTSASLIFLSVLSLIGMDINQPRHACTHQVTNDSVSLIIFIVALLDYIIIIITIVVVGPSRPAMVRSQVFWTALCINDVCIRLFSVKRFELSGFTGFLCLSESNKKSPP